MNSRYLGLAVGFGWSLAVSVGVLAYGGHLLDQKLRTDPWLMIAGILSGIVIAFKQLLTQLSRLESESKAARGEGAAPADSTGGQGKEP